MSSFRTNNTGIDHGLRWDSLPLDEGPISWSFDASQGVVQGPLDLESFKGQSMMLSLETGQTALLIQDKEMRAIFLDGSHNLLVGHGFNHIAPSASLVFISTANTLQLRWKKDNPVHWNDEKENGIIGHCNVSITNPVAFYASYLQNIKSIAKEHALAAIDATVRQVLAEMIGSNPLGDGPNNAAELQSRLTCLSNQTLTEDLAAQGLTCHQLSLYAMAPHVGLNMETSTRHTPVHY